MLYLSLGSNLGNRISNLRQAFELLQVRCLNNATYSIIIETQAIVPDQADISWNLPYLNMIVKGGTNFTPEELLKEIKSIELEMGRPKNYTKWSPRIIDIDILIWHDLRINIDDLVIPHPEIHNRPFLLHLLSLMGEKSYRVHPYIQSFSKSFVLYPKIVGILNVTTDSFSDGGIFYNRNDAIDHVIKLHSEGASIIEIGAQSTRPGAIIQSEKEEYNTLVSLLDSITPLIMKSDLKISIDTFHSSIIKKLLEQYPISIVNDVKGTLDNEVLQYISVKNCKICIMHSISIPPNSDLIIPTNQNTMLTILNWAKAKIAKLLQLGFKQEDIIIDPGIGFGKSTYQNIDILNDVEILRECKTSLMIGHSRKGFLNAFSNIAPPNRDLETIAVSLYLQNKVDLLRVHNVKDHMRALVMHQYFHQDIFQ